MSSSGNALRPMDLGELLDRTFFLYRTHFLLFVGIAALPHLLLLAAQIFDTVFLSRPVVNDPLDPWSILSSINIPSLVIQIVLMLFVGAATQSATVSAVSRLYLGGQTSVAEAYAAVMTRIPFIVLMMIVLGLATAVGFVFCIAPAVILSLLWCLAIPVAILEHKGIIASASRSFELTSGWRLRVLVIYILYFVLIYIVSFITQLPVLAIGFIAALSSGGDASAIPTWTIVASTIGTFVSSCLATPLLTVALSLVYYNQRVQKEAFDLQHMMTLLDDAAPRTAL